MIFPCSLVGAKISLLSPYILIKLAPVVQTLDSAIHRINLYPADSVIDFCNTYPLDSDFRLQLFERWITPSTE